MAALLLWGQLHHKSGSKMAARGLTLTGLVNVKWDGTIFFPCALPNSTIGQSNSRVPPPGALANTDFRPYATALSRTSESRSKLKEDFFPREPPVNRLMRLILLFFISSRCHGRVLALFSPPPVCVLFIFHATAARQGKPGSSGIDVVIWNLDEFVPTAFAGPHSLLCSSSFRCRASWVPVSEI